MSLQVWLPLDGRLDNFGLTDISMTNANATVDANGKIGKCYYFNGTNARIYANNVSISNNQMSGCCWIKAESLSNSYSPYIFSLGSYTGGAGQQIGIFWDGSVNKIALAANGSYLNSGYSLSLNIWYHICFTYKGSSSKLYINGQLVSTVINANSPQMRTCLCIGARSNSTSGAGVAFTYPFQGWINDVRIYNHCLSAKQVKEISKGLVRHYPLNEMIGNPNLLRNTSFKKKHSQTNWNVSKNGDQQPDYWSFYNSGVSNPSTCYHAHLVQFSGEQVVEYIILESGTWLGAVQENLQTILVPGTRYTFSIWQYIPQESNNNLTINFHGYVENSNSAKSLIYLSCNSNIVYNKWQKFSFSIVLPSDTDYTKRLRLYIYGHHGIGTVYMKRPKLEEGSEVTPWVPNINDAEYSSYDLGNVVYDCSGYGRNGILSPTAPTYGSQSPRYFNCMAFNGTNNYIDCGLSGNGNLPTDAITVCGWGYRENWDSDTQQRLISCTQNGGFNFQGKTTQFIVYRNGSYAYATNTLSKTTGWYFFAGTYDGYVAKFYINGQLMASSNDTSATSTKYPISYNSNAKLLIGCEPSGSTPSSPYWNGKISDIRIYCTALSAQDIKELYQSSLSVDNMGNFHTHEIFENTEVQS